MSGTPKHTPTPWTLKPNGVAFNLWSDDRTNSFCMLVGYRGQPEGEHTANSEFIARACNAHEKLLAACEKAEEAIEDRMDNASDPEALARWQKQCKRAGALCRAAIAEANGEPWPPT